MKSRLLEDRPTISFHVDAVQKALAKVATEVYLPERVDFATFSSHKFHGLRGVGFVYIKEKTKITSPRWSRKRNTLDNWERGRYCSNSKSPSSHGKPKLFASKTQQMKESHPQGVANYPDVTVFWRESFCASYLDFFSGSRSSWKWSMPLKVYLHLDKQCLLVQNW